MGRGRAPCCEKIGLNKGSWTPEEDMRLIAYIHKFGHGNWRALPKQAGLLRCGKSCRLRWINYLRPDIKRGNFTKDEEDTIIKLHGLLGNKWSKIASCLPGRTDNEIKNVWNTHLKKRVKKRLEDAPDSPSCSNPNSEPNQDEKIEIPIEPNLDVWLEDSLSEPPTKIISPCSSSSDVGLNDPNLDEIPDIEPELWRMIEDELGGVEEGGGDQSRTNLEAESSGGDDDSRRWLAYLEDELNLGEVGPWADVEAGDPVSSYFQTRPNSPSGNLDLLLT